LPDAGGAESRDLPAAAEALFNFSKSPPAPLRGSDGRRTPPPRPLTIRTRMSSRGQGDPEPQTALDANQQGRNLLDLLSQEDVAALRPVPHVDDARRARLRRLWRDLRRAVWEEEAAEGLEDWEEGFGSEGSEIDEAEGEGKRGEERSVTVAYPSLRCLRCAEKRKKCVHEGGGVCFACLRWASAAASADEAKRRLGQCVTKLVVAKRIVADVDAELAAELPVAALVEASGGEG
jgi:hypothetical protein